MRTFGGVFSDSEPSRVARISFSLNEAELNHSLHRFRKAEILDRVADRIEQWWFSEQNLALFQNAFCKRELRGNPPKFRSALKRVE